MIKGFVVVIFWPRTVIYCKIVKSCLVYIFYHYKAFCLLYILSEITFQFYFLRYKTLLYIYLYTPTICSYGFKFFTLFKKHFLPIIIHSTFSISSSLPFPSCHFVIPCLSYGKVPNYIQFHPSKITLKNITWLDKNINLLKKKNLKLMCNSYSKWYTLFKGLPDRSQFLILLWLFYSDFDWSNTYS